MDSQQSNNATSQLPLQTNKMTQDPTNSQTLAKKEKRKMLLQSKKAM